MKTPREPCIAESVECDAICCAYSSNSEFVFIGTRDGHVNVYKTPRPNVERLVDICRRIVNQLVERENIDKLNLPSDLENYLCYDDIRPIKTTELKGKKNNNKTSPSITNQIFETNFSSFNYALNSISLFS